MLQQLIDWQTYTHIVLFIRSKIQFFESKSQLSINSVEILVSCLSDQRYNFLKANHNNTQADSYSFLVVYQIKDTIFWKQITTKGGRFLIWTMLFIRSKIQFFESKSQRSTQNIWKLMCCLSDQRYNFLKANHNSRWMIAK